VEDEIAAAMKEMIFVAGCIRGSIEYGLFRATSRIEVKFRMAFARSRTIARAAGGALWVDPLSTSYNPPCS